MPSCGDNACSSGQIQACGLVPMVLLTVTILANVACSCTEAGVFAIQACIRPCDVCLKRRACKGAREEAVPAAMFGCFSADGGNVRNKGFLSHVSLMAAFRSFCTYELRTPWASQISSFCRMRYHACAGLMLQPSANGVAVLPESG